MRELIASGEVNVNSKDDEGRTLLALSMSNINADSISLVEDLLKQKNAADVNSQDAKGCTPLYHLVESMSQRKKDGGADKRLFGQEDMEELEFKIVKMLLKAGADINIRAKNDKSPLTLAFESAMLSLIEVFGETIDLNVDPSLFFAVSDTILKESTQDMMREFISGKGRIMEDEAINFVNDHGFTPFLWYIHKALEIKPKLLRVI